MTDAKAPAPPITNVQAKGSARPDDAELQALRGTLFALQPLTPQRRGFAIERFLNDLFQIYGLDPRRSFRLIGEQIDGSFQLGQDVYVVEAKYERHPTAQAELLAFAGKVEGQAQWSRGLFISYTGSTTEDLEAYSRGRATRIIRLDGFDPFCVLERSLDLRDVLSRKVRRAGETNEAHVSVRNLYPHLSF